VDLCCGDDLHLLECLLFAVPGIIRGDCGEEIDFVHTFMFFKADTGQWDPS
jgi:hypothetical protein